MPTAATTSAVATFLEEDRRPRRRWVRREDGISMDADDSTGATSLTGFTVCEAEGTTSWADFTGSEVEGTTSSTGPLCVEQRTTATPRGHLRRQRYSRRRPGTAETATTRRAQQRRRVVCKNSDATGRRRQRYSRRRPGTAEATTTLTSTSTSSTTRTRRNNGSARATTARANTFKDGGGAKLHDVDDENDEDDVQRARRTALHRSSTAQHFGVDGNGSDHDGCEQYREDDDYDVQRARRRVLHDD